LTPNLGRERARQLYRKGRELQLPMAGQSESPAHALGRGRRLSGRVDLPELDASRRLKLGRHFFPHRGERFAVTAPRGVAACGGGNAQQASNIS